MGPYINAAKEECINISSHLSSKLQNDFRFGFVFYRDPINDASIHEKIELTKEIENIPKMLERIVATGGGDADEDYAGGYELALSQSWRKGIKLIIHIGDACGHGLGYSDNSTYASEGERCDKLFRKCAEQQIRIVCLSIGLLPRKSFEHEKIIYNEANGPFFDIYNFDNSNPAKISAIFKDLVIKAAISAAPKSSK